MKTSFFIFQIGFFWEAKLRAGELGVQAPVGFWDPLGLSADGDALTLHMTHAI